MSDTLVVLEDVIRLVDGLLDVVGQPGVTTDEPWSANPLRHNTPVQAWSSPPKAAPDASKEASKPQPVKPAIAVLPLQPAQLQSSAATDAAHVIQPNSTAASSCQPTAEPITDSRSRRRCSAAGTHAVPCMPPQEPAQEPRHTPSQHLATWAPSTASSSNPSVFQQPMSSMPAVHSWTMPAAQTAAAAAAAVMQAARLSADEQQLLVAVSSEEPIISRRMSRMTRGSLSAVHQSMSGVPPQLPAQSTSTSQGPASRSSTRDTPGRRVPYRPSQEQEAVLAAAMERTQSLIQRDMTASQLSGDHLSAHRPSVTRTKKLRPTPDDPDSDDESIEEEEDGERERGLGEREGSRKASRPGTTMGQLPGIAALRASRMSYSRRVPVGSTSGTMESVREAVQCDSSPGCTAFARLSAGGQQLAGDGGAPTLLECHLPHAFGSVVPAIPVDDRTSVQLAHADRGTTDVRSLTGTLGTRHSLSPPKAHVVVPSGGAHTVTMGALIPAPRPPTAQPSPSVSATLPKAPSHLHPAVSFTSVATSSPMSPSAGSTPTTPLRPMGMPAGAAATFSRMAVPGLETPKGLKLWTGNKSKADVARLGVRLIQACALAPAGKSGLDPFAVVKVERAKHVTRALTKSSEPYWDEFFVFEVRSPAFAVLRIKVYDHLRCWRPQLVGQVRISVKTVSDAPERFAAPTWHTLRTRKGRPTGGQVLVQLYYVSERVHRPLNVMCCTWNVGNAPPPEDLRAWLKGVDTLEHDLVAIGVQECAYKVKGGGGALAQELYDYDEEWGEEGSVIGGNHLARTLTGFVSPSVRRSSFGVQAQGSVRPNGQAPITTNSVSLAEIFAPTIASADHTRPSLTSSLGQVLPGRLRTGGTETVGDLPETDITRSASVSMIEGSLGPGNHNSIVGGPVSHSAAAFAAARARVRGVACPHAAGVPSRFGPSGALARLSADRFVEHYGGGAGDSCGLPQMNRGAHGACRSRGHSSQTLPSVRFGPGLIDGGRSRGHSSQTLPTMRPMVSPVEEPLLETMDAGEQLFGELLSGSSHPPAIPLPTLPHAARMNPAPSPSAQYPAVPLEHLRSHRRHSLPLPLLTDPAAGRFGEGSVHGSVRGGSGDGRRLVREGSMRGGAAFREGSVHGGHSGLRDSVGGPHRVAHKKTGFRDVTAEVGGRGFKDEWEDTLKAVMGAHYFMVRSVHMGQIRLLLFARNDIYPAISKVERGSQATGVAGVATNKGGVAIALQVWDTELCFVNSHLAAHQDKVRARNNHYRDIVRGLRLEKKHAMDVLTAYHHTFWMGDLNYRLDYGGQATNPTETPLPADFDALCEEIAAERLPQLLAVDQLRRELAAGRAFLGFAESDPLFKPTFKVERRRGLAYKSQRSPAWCDRVLVRSNLPLKTARTLDYFSAPDISTSDHKPVGAIFSVPTVWRQDDPTASTKFTLLIMRIACHGLFMLRRRRQSSASTLPNPQIILAGPCITCPGSEWHSPVLRQTCEPVWGGGGGTMSGSAQAAAAHRTAPGVATSLPLVPAAIQDLAHRRLLVRVVDVGDGKVVSGVNTIARGVLPLTQAAMAMLQTGGKAAKPTSVQLEYNGLPAGHMEVEMLIEVEVRPSLEHSAPRTLMQRLSMAPAIMKASMTRSSSQNRGGVVERSPSFKAPPSGEL